MPGAAIVAQLCNVSPVHGERVPEDGTRAGPVKPHNDGGDLLWLAESANRLAPYDVLHSRGPRSDHFSNDRRFDRSETHGVAPNTAGSVLESGTSRRPDYAVFGRMIDRPARYANEAAKR